jgi:hypothetical protein
VTVRRLIGIQEADPLPISIKLNKNNHEIELVKLNNTPTCEMAGFLKIIRDCLLGVLLTYGEEKNKERSNKTIRFSLSDSTRY